MAQPTAICLPQNESRFVDRTVVQILGSQFFDRKSWTLNDPIVVRLHFWQRATLAVNSAARPGRVHRQCRTANSKPAAQSYGALMMTYDQLRELSRHGHIVGSHTMTHPNMAHVNEDDAQRELGESKQRLESQLGAPIKHFSILSALSPHWSQQTEQSHALGTKLESPRTAGSRATATIRSSLKRLHPTKTVEGLRWNLESAFAGRTV